MVSHTDQHSYTRHSHEPTGLFSWLFASVHALAGAQSGHWHCRPTGQTPVTRGPTLGAAGPVVLPSRWHPDPRSLQLPALRTHGSLPGVWLQLLPTHTERMPFSQEKSQKRNLIKEDRPPWSGAGHGQTSVSPIYTHPALSIPSSLYLPVANPERSPNARPQHPVTRPTRQAASPLRPEGDLPSIRLDGSHGRAAGLGLCWDRLSLSPSPSPGLPPAFGTRCSPGLGEMGRRWAGGSCGGAGSRRAG